MSSKIYRTTSWYDARVEIRPSLIQGGGMFARQPIQVGEIVAIVGGSVMTEDEFHAYSATVPRFNATRIGERLHLVDLIQAPETVAGSINHSCDSNLWLRDEVTMVARRAIASGEANLATDALQIRAMRLTDSREQARKEAPAFCLHALGLFE